RHDFYDHDHAGPGCQPWPGAALPEFHGVALSPRLRVIFKRIAVPQAGELVKDASVAPELLPTQSGFFLASTDWLPRPTWSESGMMTAPPRQSFRMVRADASVCGAGGAARPSCFRT
ncbi:MAG TPA: hypothetical protein VKG61_02255, partial [Streptosporangiaceae bacterium]|nr:hypothetical protein [Streptosporangiaceae bacterium]